MTFCSNCGAEVKEDKKFCGKCGTAINEDDQQTSNTNNNTSSTSGVTYSCPYCGKKIPYSTKCPYCGKKLQGNNDAAKIGIGIIAIIILIILFAGIAGFLLLIFA